MNLNITNILDTSKENHSRNKIILADTIIKKMEPFFDELRNAKLKSIESLDNKILNMKFEIRTKKEEIKKNLASYEREQISKEYYDKIHMIIQTGNAKSDGLRKELIVMVKVLPKLDNDKIKSHIKKLDLTLNKMLKLNSWVINLL